MVQPRVKVGKQMELSAQKNGWISCPTRPKLTWRVEGKSNIDKIKNSNYNPVKFAVLENANLEKYDIYNPTTNKKREVKAYHASNLNRWVLYSEPYFKVSSRSQLTKINKDIYNDFVDRFYTHANQIGLISYIQDQMVSSSEGIVFKDGFISKKQLQFRTIISDQEWSGYNRIQIQFKINY